MRPAIKEQITLWPAADAVRPVRTSGKGFQSRINAVLKGYGRAQE